MESTRRRVALDHRRAQTGESRNRRGVFDSGSAEAVKGGMAGEVDGGGVVWGPGGFEGGVCEGEDGVRGRLRLLQHEFLKNGGSSLAYKTCGQ